MVWRYGGVASVTEFMVWRYGGVTSVTEFMVWRDGGVTNVTELMVPPPPTSRAKPANNEQRQEERWQGTNQ
jgi:hypothetical protein